MTTWATRTGADPAPHADIHLARRLERAEGAANAAFVQASAALEPSSSATWISVAGVYGMFDGVASPLTQTFGLGIFDPIGERELEELERFFLDRGADVCHEVSPFLSPELLQLLNERGYRPVEHSTVLTRSTVIDSTSDTDLVVREITSDESDLWSRVSGEGWRSESAEAAAFIKAFGKVITHADGVHCFLAKRGDDVIAAAALGLHGEVALLAGASTIPSARRLGAQRALLDHRLRFANAHDIALAMVVTQPGSGSQRNAERRGFRVAYTRTKWKLERQSGTG